MRLDSFLSQQLRLPRNQIQKMIERGDVRVAGRVVTKSSLKVTGAELIDSLLPSSKGLSTLKPEAIPLSILYEDDHIAVVNKPAGLVVHPGAGHPSQTMVNALLHLYGTLPVGSEEQKPGLVHRLDKGTSGCLVVARSLLAMNHLTAQFKNRKVEKIYLALVAGRVPPQGIFDKPIGRHAKMRQKISSYTRKGRDARTEWKTLEYFGDRFSWVEIRLHTGRMHQIRVHFAEAGHPVVGDPAYGRGRKTATDLISRPALHAWRLGFSHPATGEWIAFEAPLPLEMSALLKNLC